MAERSASEDPFSYELEASTLDAMEVDRDRYDHTKNPLIIWQALNTWFTLNHHRALARKAPLPMPEWIASYLCVVARRITDLANGLDYQEAPEPYGALPRAQESVQRAKSRVQTLTPDKASNRVPAALGLVRKGWNAFERLSSRRSKEIDALSTEGYRWKTTVEKACNMILDGHVERARATGVKPKVTDPRSVRRRNATLKQGKGFQPRG
jgi:hypothetical protein